MAKAIAIKRTLNRLDLQNLSERDRDFLTLETKDVMKKYKIEKQSVYDRKFALNKKIRQAGLSVEKLLNKNSSSENSSSEIPKPPKKVAAKKAKQAKAVKLKPEEPKVEDTPKEPIRDIVKYEKPIPVIMKPIEINFENFSVKLNGVPKKISVNPDTNSIEIDL